MSTSSHEILRLFVRALAPLVLAACGASSRSASSSPGAAAVPRREYRQREPELKCDAWRNAPPKLDGTRDSIRAACASGEPRACYALTNEAKPPPADLALAQHSMRALCEQDRAGARKGPNDVAPARDRTCSCGTYGLVLAWDVSKEREALVLLDDACVHGLVDACDLAAVIGDLCVHKHTPGCDDLAEQGRITVPTTEEGADAAPLGAALRGCFVVREVGPSSREESWSSPPIAGTTFCFEDDRLSTRPPGGAWDQVAVSWRGYGGVDVYWHSGSRNRLSVDGTGALYGAARLSRAPDSVTREARALPYVRDVCKRAHRCEEAERRARAKPTPKNPKPPQPTLTPTPVEPAGEEIDMPDAPAEASEDSWSGECLVQLGCSPDTLHRCLEIERYLSKFRRCE